MYAIIISALLLWNLKAGNVCFTFVHIYNMSDFSMRQKCGKLLGSNNKNIHVVFAKALWKVGQSCINISMSNKSYICWWLNKETKHVRGASCHRILWIFFIVTWPMCFVILSNSSFKWCQVGAWQLATLLITTYCKSVPSIQLISAWVEEPVSPARQSFSGVATNNPPFPKML